MSLGLHGHACHCSVMWGRLPWLSLFKKASATTLLAWLSPFSLQPVGRGGEVLSLNSYTLIDCGWTDRQLNTLLKCTAKTKGGLAFHGFCSAAPTCYVALLRMDGRTDRQTSHSWKHFPLYCCNVLKLVFLKITGWHQWLGNPCWVCPELLLLQTRLRVLNCLYFHLKRK